MRRDDHVGILMPDSPDYAALLLAIWLSGGVAVPINGRYKSEEVRHVIAHSDLRLIVVDDDESDSFGYRSLIASVVRTGCFKSAGEFPALEGVLQLNGPSTDTSLRAFGLRGFVPADQRDLPVRAAHVLPGDVAAVFYTSGTTSKPKGCLLTHNAIARHSPNALGNALGVVAGDRVFAPLPLFHAGGIAMLLGCMSLGATMIHMGRFDPWGALDILESEECTVAYAPFEAMWGAIMTHPRLAEADLSALRVAVYCAPPARVEQSQQATPGTIVVSAYGSTESATNLTMGHPDEPPQTRMGTVGRVVEGMEIMVVEVDRRVTVPPGQPGELLFRGYSRLKGYYKDDKLTRELIEPEGWFASGDLASIDAGISSLSWPIARPPQGRRRKCGLDRNRGLSRGPPGN
jgi:fatty-acyl-CoA synthase